MTELEKLEISVKAALDVCNSVNEKQQSVYLEGKIEGYEAVLRMIENSKKKS